VVNDRKIYILGKMTYSIVEAIEAIDDMAEHNPELGDRFVRESRRYWAAKKEVFDYRKYYVHIAREFPYLFMFDSWTDYQQNYSKIVIDTLREEKHRQGLDKKASELIKYVTKRLKELDPEDNTILPLVAYEGKISVLLPNDKIVPLLIGKYSKTG
jgi:hypothetical protein